VFSGGNALTSFRLKPNESGGKMYVICSSTMSDLSVAPFKWGGLTWLFVFFSSPCFDGTKVPKPSVLHVERGWRHVCGGRITLWQCGQRFVFCGVGIGRAMRRFAGRGDCVHTQVVSGTVCIHSRKFENVFERRVPCIQKDAPIVATILPGRRW
jgi:hypothetical protein